MENGKGTKPLVVHFQLRPDPLAKCKFGFGSSCKRRSLFIVRYHHYPDIITLRQITKQYGIVSDIAVLFVMSVVRHKRATGGIDHEALFGC